MIRYLAPLVLFLGVVGFLAAGLSRDPRLIPSPLVGKPAPGFALQSLKSPEQTLTLADLKGKVLMLNVWATWCAACHAEHPLLMELARVSAIPIYGVNYKDERTKAIDWLARLGDPYVASIYDPNGELALDLGVYGAPETFVLDANGIIAYKHVGPITAEVWQDRLLPLLRSLTNPG